MEIGVRAVVFLGAVASVSFYGLSIGTKLFLGIERAQALYQSPVYALSPGGMTLGRWAVLITVVAGAYAGRRRIARTVSKGATLALWVVRNLRTAIRNGGEHLRRLGPRNMAVIAFLWIVPPAILGYLAFEVFVRLYFLASYGAMNHTLVVKNRTLNFGSLDELRDNGETDHPLGLFKANQSFTTTFYRPREGDKIGFQVTVRTNNLGYLSERSYQIERSGGEYRVVIIGDSYTGTTTMSSPWVDRVEDLLNADVSLREAIGGKAIRVFNLGWPGAGFAHFIEVLEKKAPQFDPDLVVVNYIEADFPRRRQGGGSRPDNTIVSGIHPMAVDDTPEGRFYNLIICSEPPVSLGNPQCYQPECPSHRKARNAPGRRVHGA